MDAAECESFILASLSLSEKTLLLTARAFQGLVTSAQKLNRKGLQEKYKKEIDQAYGKK